MSQPERRGVALDTTAKPGLARVTGTQEVDGSRGALGDILAAAGMACFRDDYDKLPPEARDLVGWEAIEEALLVAGKELAESNLGFYSVELVGMWGMKIKIYGGVISLSKLPV